MKLRVSCAGFGGFGGTATTLTTPAFGATGTTGFGAGGGFGAALGSTPSLFGQSTAAAASNAFGFKTPAASTTFGLGTTGGLFATQRTSGHTLTLLHWY